MSFIDTASDAASAYPFQSAFSAALSPALIRPRNIGPFVADITISERHRDELILTKHPVSTGSVITDHAYKLPIRVIITVGFSNSDANANGDANYVQTIYQNFLTLQENRELFSVTTGKRTLNNMLIEYINELTTEQTENALILEIACHEIILATTSTASVSPSGTSTPNNQADPAVNASPASQGTQQLQPTTNYNSALYNTGVPAADINAP